MGFFKVRWKRLVGWVFTALFFVPVAYLIASLVGAVVPATISADSHGQKKDVRIYLLAGLLHTDIAIPATREVLRQFSFLKQAAIPLDNSSLRYLVFGWGSKQFYTTTGTYADISIRATFTAIIGDRSVMHIVPYGAIDEASEAIPISVSQNGLARMVHFIRGSFKKDDRGNPLFMPGKSHGYGDVFFEGVGGFNILHPCNTWTSRALNRAGVATGIWTPTTQSLKWSLGLHGG